MTHPEPEPESAAGLHREVTIINDLGLHARSAARIAALAKKAGHGVWLATEGDEVDAKSTLDILTLYRPKGSKVKVRVEKRTDMKTLAAIVKLIENGFGENSSR